VSEKLKEIIDLICLAIGMVINFTKSSISLCGTTDLKLIFITYLYPFNTTEIEIVLTYLGFQLKAIMYQKRDWQWLIAKKEKKLNLW